MNPKGRIHSFIMKTSGPRQSVIILWTWGLMQTNKNKGEEIDSAKVT